MPRRDTVCTVATTRDEAVVLRAWDFSETSQTVALFARDAGVIRGLAKGAKRPKSKFSGGFEPLTRGEIIAIIKPQTDLATLTEWDLREVFWGPRRDLRAHRAGLFAADVALRSVEPEDPHPALFDALVAMLRGLEGATANEHAADTLVMHYLRAVLREIGYFPRTDAIGELLASDAPVLGFDAAAGAFGPDPGPDAPRHLWRVRAETAAAFSDESTTTAPEAGAPGAARLLAAYVAWVLGGDLVSREALFGPLPHSN